MIITTNGASKVVTQMRVNIFIGEVCYTFNEEIMPNHVNSSGQLKRRKYIPTDYPDTKTRQRHCKKKKKQ